MAGMLSRSLRGRAGATCVPRAAAAGALVTRRGFMKYVKQWHHDTKSPFNEPRMEEVPESELGVPRSGAKAPERLVPPSSLRPEYERKETGIPFPSMERQHEERVRRFIETTMGRQGISPDELPPNSKWVPGVQGGSAIAAHTLHPLRPSRKVVDDYDIVIVGGGAGGHAVAAKLCGNGSAMRDLAATLNKEGNRHLPMNESRFNYKILIIEPSKEHHYQPMWTLVGGGKRPLKHAVQSNVKIAMNNKDVHVLPTSVAEFWPDDNAVITADGRQIKYKQLVVAAGLEVKIDKVKGLRDALGRAGVSTNYVYPYPERTWDFVRFFPGGNAIFTVPSGTIKCAGAPQKIMYLAEEYWRRHVGRDLCNIKFVSGGARLFGIPKYEKALIEHCERVGINDRQFGLNLIEVDYVNKNAIFEKVGDPTAAPVSMPYDFLHVTPPQGPYDFIAKSKLADANGWVDVNKETLQHTRWPNVFGIGDCTSTPNSKTASAVGAQAAIVAENLVRFREDRAITAKYDGYTACPFTLGYNRSIIAEFDYTNTPKESFPVDGAVPSKFLYYVKSELLPMVYWERLVRGFHDMQDYRGVMMFLRRFFGPSETPAPAASSS